MKKVQVGDMIKTKAGDKGIILDFFDKRKKILIVNLEKMQPEEIEENQIAEFTEDPNYKITVDGKNVRIEKTSETIEQEQEKDDDDLTEKFRQSMKLLGKASIALGNILTEIGKSVN